MGKSTAIKGTMGDTETRYARHVTSRSVFSSQSYDLCVAGLDRSDLDSRDLAVNQLRWAFPLEDDLMDGIAAGMAVGQLLHRRHRQYWAVLSIRTAADTAVFTRPLDSHGSAERHWFAPLDGHRALSGLLP